MKELRDLESKSWANLWNAIRYHFEALMTEEAKEKADLESNIKNAAKKFAKEEKPSKGAKRTAAFAAAAATREKKPKEPKPPKEPKKPKVEGDDIKKFLKPKRTEKHAEEMTNGNAAGDAGSDIVMLDDDNEASSPVKSEPVKKSAPKKIKIVDSDESVSDSPSEEQASPVKKPPAKKKNLAAGDISDTETTSKRAKRLATYSLFYIERQLIIIKTTSDDYDVFEIPDDDDEKPAAKKKAPAKKTAAPPKKERAPAKAKKENGTTDSPKMTDFFGKKSKAREVNAQESDEEVE
ncbi:hypothetical protein OSTOST_22823 [Ostertagia ostertagi]